MKPLIRECIHEVLVGEGILAKVVSEVAKGMGNVIVENRPTKPNPVAPPDNSALVEHHKKKMQEVRAKLTKSVGESAYSNIFEGVEAAPHPSEPRAGALSDVSSHDPGVDISSIVSLSGNRWKSLVPKAKE